MEVTLPTNPTGINLHVIHPPTSWKIPLHCVSAVLTVHSWGESKLVKSTGSMEKMSTNECFTRCFGGFRYTPGNQHVPRKMMVGRLCSFWNGPFSGDLHCPVQICKICLSLDICPRVFDRYVFGSLVIPNLSSVCDWILNVWGLDFRKYCWWRRSCTSWQAVYPIIHVIFTLVIYIYISQLVQDFCPSTVSPKNSGT